ncbi:hypothetical protein FGO68_gene10318 [Halteria grandinella]|uniref:PHD-type domain-containing protein n=1 Tax=Halteria grandinella TaxID=5974 RepID=A0A8J8NQ21_HALGN|nr:hypothetical protein FGO68_gene10318 [Halteria grandinella]
MIYIQQDPIKILNKEDKVLGFKSKLDLDTMLKVLSTYSDSDIKPSYLTKLIGKLEKSVTSVQQENTQKSSQNPSIQVTTQYSCALQESEMNKVELAYFHRAKQDNRVILSDRDACRLMKGQIVPNVNLKITDDEGQSMIRQRSSGGQGQLIKVPRECRIEISQEGAMPMQISYDDQTQSEDPNRNRVKKHFHHKHHKCHLPNCQTPRNLFKQRVGDIISKGKPSSGFKSQSAFGQKDNEGKSKSLKTLNLGPKIGIKSSSLKNQKLHFKAKSPELSFNQLTDSQKLTSLEIDHITQDQSKCHQTLVTDASPLQPTSLFDSPQLIKCSSLPPSSLNKKLYCICQQEYKSGNLMFQCEGPCAGWYHPACVNMLPQRAQELKNSKEPWVCDFCLNFQSKLKMKSNGSEREIG